MTRASSAEARVVEAARRLFLDNGWDGVNMDAVAAAAGVARQTLYNRFGSKEALFQAAIDAHWARFERPDVLLDPDRALKDVLADVAREILAFVRNADQIKMIRTVIADSRAYPGIATAFYQRGKAPLIDAFTQYLSESAKRGRLDCPDPRLAARQFLGMIQESLLWPQVMQTGAPQASSKRVIDSAIQGFIRMYGSG